MCFDDTEHISSDDWSRHVLRNGPSTILEKIRKYLHPSESSSEDRRGRLHACWYFHRESTGFTVCFESNRSRGRTSHPSYLYQHRPHREARGILPRGSKPTMSYSSPMTFWIMSPRPRTINAPDPPGPPEHLVALRGSSRSQGI